MGIQQDGEAVLRALVAWPHDGDVHCSVRTQDLHRTKLANWKVPRLNDAIQWLVKNGYVEDEDVGGCAPYEMGGLATTMEGRLAAESLAERIDSDAVLAVNQNARRLLAYLHGAHLSVAGASYSLSFGDETQRETRLDYPQFKQAGERLVERGLADRKGHAAYGLTPTGVEAAEDQELLDRILPVKATAPAMNSNVHEANERARRLLAYLQEWSMKGAAFRIGPNDETFKATNLSEEEYREAAIRLIRKHLAKHSGTGYWITVTDDGVRVAEDDSALDHQLPVGQAENRQKGLAMSDKKKVFIIHGRNAAARVAVELFLQALKLEPLDFDQLAADMGTEFVGNIVVEGLKRAHGIVTLFTPDEYAALFTGFREVHETDAMRWQSRPNVIFEAGIAFGLARDRSILATMGSGVSLFSDVKGIHIVRLDNTEDSRKKFRQKLIGAGCEVDLRADSYTDPTRSGDFEAPVAGLVGVSPLDPFRTAP